MAVTKADQTAAVRLLNKAVAIGRAHAVLAKTADERRRVALDNAVRFHNAIEAAALLLETPVSLKGTTC